MDQFTARSLVPVMVPLILTVFLGSPLEAGGAKTAYRTKKESTTANTYLKQTIQNKVCAALENRGHNLSDQEKSKLKKQVKKEMNNLTERDLMVLVNNPGADQNAGYLNMIFSILGTVLTFIWQMTFGLFF